MGKKKKIEPESNHSLRKVVLFLIIVAVLIILSLSVRFMYLVKQSKYDGESRFTVVVNESEEKAIILSFNPLNKSLSKMVLKGNRENEPAGKIVGIPVDGTINLPGEANNESPSSLLMYALSNPLVKKETVTVLDVLQLYFFARTVSPANNLNEEVSVSDDLSSINPLALRLFSDQRIVDEQLSIEIMNGTGINGLGKRLERIIINSGGNVVAVSNSHSVEEKSKILYFQNTSYTLNKLQRILNYPLELMQNQDIADIKIIVGKDGIKENVF